MKNTLIFKALVGSRAYGTNNENSDTDYKGVYIQNIDENNFEKMDILGKAPDIDFILHKQKVLYIG